MAENPFFDLNWWADFLKTDVVVQNEMLTRAMCTIQGLTFDGFEAFAKHLMEQGKIRFPSGYAGPFDEHYLYPLCVGFEVRVKQPPGRLELHAVDRHLFYNEKTLLITQADPQVDWNRALKDVLEDIRMNYPHIPAWHEAMRVYQYLEQLNDPGDLDDPE